jgi:uncharacterized phage protein gp47/JayE
MAGIYVTAAGFQKKTLAEIKLEVEANFKTIFGDNIDLDPESNFSQMIGKISKDYADLWDALQEIYTARNPNQATGTSQDFIAAENALQRIPASETTVSNVVLKGSDGTVVAAGKKARQPDEPNALLEYTLDSAVTIDKATARWGLISVTTIAAGNYTVTIGATPYTYVATGVETKNQILQAIEALIDAGAWVGTATTDTTNEQLQLQDDDTNFSFTITGNLQIEEVGSAGDFTATITGANTLPANSLTEIVTPVANWNSVNNPSPGTTGRAVETDSEFRLRREQSIAGIGNATDEAIRSNVLNDVDGVTSVTVYSNRTSSTDGEGRPANTFEAVVQGGDDTELANKIWNIQPSGIASYGNTTVNITDSQGITQPIKFSRPEDVYIFVRVKRDKYNEEDYPIDGDDLIKQAIVDWSLIETNISIGKDVIRQRLSEPVYSVPGIEDILIELDSSTSLPHTPSYSAANVIIGDRQLAVFALAQIVVEDLTP